MTDLYYYVQPLELLALLFCQKSLKLSCPICGMICAAALNAQSSVRDICVGLQHRFAALPQSIRSRRWTGLTVRRENGADDPNRHAAKAAG
jgi:hypothetical protein